MASILIGVGIAFVVCGAGRYGGMAYGQVLMIRIVALWGAKMPPGARGDHAPTLARDLCARTMAMTAPLFRIFPLPALKKDDNSIL